MRFHGRSVLPKFCIISRSWVTNPKPIYRSIFGPMVHSVLDMYTRSVQSAAPLIELLRLKSRLELNPLLMLKLLSLLDFQLIHVESLKKPFSLSSIVNKASGYTTN